MSSTNHTPMILLVQHSVVILSRHPKFTFQIRVPLSGAPQIKTAIFTNRLSAVGSFAGTSKIFQWLYHATTSTQFFVASFGLHKSVISVALFGTKPLLGRPPMEWLLTPFAWDIGTAMIGHSLANLIHY